MDVCVGLRLINFESPSGAVGAVLEHNAHLQEVIPYGIGLGSVFVRPCLGPLLDHLLHLIGVDRFGIAR